MYYPIWVYERPLVGVLSIHKLRVGQEAYQLSGVAQSLDAYYTGAGEAHGQWVGGSAARLGLDGEVQPDDLRAVLAGLAPGTGGLSPNGDTPRLLKRRVPGFDLTFKAPKSASVLYAISDDPRVQAAVVEAGEKAMRAAIGWLEREAIQVQRGSHNTAWLASHGGDPEAGPRRAASSGVIAASFRHRTSRAGDPLLHWHVLVANLVEGADHKWSAFAHPDLYRHARAAGEIFQSVYRYELTQALGVEWRPGRHVPEVAGIPQPILDMFSKRSAEVDAWLASTGTPNTTEGRQAAVLATRRNKPEVEHARFDDAWKQEAIDAGWAPEHAERLIGLSLQRADTSLDDDGRGMWRLEAVGFDENGQPEQYERFVDPEEWIEHLLRCDLTAEHTTFTEANIAAAVARRQGVGATVETIERIVDRVLASPAVIPVHTASGPARYTSRELLDIEHRFTSTFTQTFTSSVSPTQVAAVLAERQTIGDDQADAVQRIAESTSAVSVLVGPAGTGKTFTVDTIRTAFESSGVTVLGAAPSARAALELADGADLPTSTLHSLLERWNRGLDAPTASSLLVIDEAGMADLRTLERIVTRQVGAGGRVLLVGDHHQLPEVGAGGGFAYAATHAGCVAELSVNHRQHAVWEQEALVQLRNGSVAAAVEAYGQHGRLVAAADAPEMITMAVDRWFAARDAGQRAVLLAGTNDLVDTLNGAVIERLRTLGELATPDVPGHKFQIGERVVIRRNTIEHDGDGGAHRLANGQVGTVTGVDVGGLTVRFDNDGGEIALRSEYLRSGLLDHAYALTTHRAQGGTWDVSIAVGADGLYREGAYVQLSRGAAENWIILTDPEAAELRRQLTAEAERHDTGFTPADERPGDIDDEFTRRLQRSGAKQLAVHADPHIGAVDELARRQPLVTLEAWAAQAAAVERHVSDRLGYHPALLLEGLERVEHVARHLVIGAQLSPNDRHNIGTVTAVDDHAGTAELHFVSNAGVEASRCFTWAELRVPTADTPERQLPPAAVDYLDRYRSDVHARVAVWNEAVEALGVDPGSAELFARATRCVVDREAHALAAERPIWLHTYLGQRPLDVAGARTWDDAVTAIAAYRARHDVIDDAIGVRPIEAAHAAEWDRVSSHLGLTRVWLDTTDRMIPLHIPARTDAELLERRAQLEQVFEGAPPDWRSTIAAIGNGKMTIDDTAELLKTALAGQHAREEWIVRHWPLVVEYAEIDRALYADAVEAGVDLMLEPGVDELELEEMSDGIDL